MALLMVAGPMLIAGLFAAGAAGGSVEQRDYAAARILFAIGCLLATGAVVAARVLP